MAGGAWLTIVEIGVFLTAAWMTGRGFKAVGLSPIIGEILAGVILGPHVLGLVPYSEPGDSGSLPTIFVLMGQVRGCGRWGAGGATLYRSVEPAGPVAGLLRATPPRARDGPYPG